MSVLSLKGLHFSYHLFGKKIPVIFNFNLDVQQGEFLAIQGSSGSGKSTLLYLMGGFLKPNLGSIIVCGKNISQLQSLELALFRSRSIGFVFQQFHLLPRANVIQNIALASEYPSEFFHNKKENLERAKKLASRLGLNTLLYNKPYQLSGGEQQRVAIARALLNNPEVILADEPTGNLDSKTANLIFSIFKEIQCQGKTVIIITHSDEIAKKCDRIAKVKDGKLVGIEKLKKNQLSQKEQKGELKKSLFEGDKRVLLIGLKPRFQWGKILISTLFNIFPLSFQTIFQNKVRSLLTMLGVIIGVASVLSMVTFSEFAQKRIIESYKKMGVNKVLLIAYRNPNLKASDTLSKLFIEFRLKEDIEPTLTVFPEINLSSPILTNWNQNPIYFGGQELDNEARVRGVSESYLRITSRKFLMGKNFSLFHVKNKSPVCVIGFQIAKRLFKDASPLNQILTIDVSRTSNKNPYPCRVLGVLASQKSNKSWERPDYQIFIPYTFFQTTNPLKTTELDKMYFQVKDNTDIKAFSEAMKRFFEHKYGKGANFVVHSDDIIVSQFETFLSFFKFLLGAIALISLIVGGIGITNVMLASFMEQIKEVGIRKALGATRLSVRCQYLLESIFLCGISGLVGIFIGFFAYESVIYLASKVISQIQFQWVISPFAFFISILSILVVGILSGLMPSLKAERLQVVEALRNE